MKPRAKSRDVSERNRYNTEYLDAAHPYTKGKRNDESIRAKELSRCFLAFGI
jgi:hypothetical protein